MCFWSFFDSTSGVVSAVAAAGSSSGVATRANFMMN
jgi:hypothetical protein